MDGQLQEDSLDARLRDEAPYLDDAGFTASVVQRLPQKRASSKFRATVLILVTILGSALAYVLSGGGRFITEGIARIGSLSLLSVGLLALCSALVAMAVAGAAAWSKAR
ncbi:MAG: hypothetical protein ABI795_05185 [Chthoniobacterales bacterium]